MIEDEDEDVNRTQDNPPYIPFPEHVPPTLYPVNLLRKHQPTRIAHPSPSPCRKFSSTLHGRCRHSTLQCSAIQCSAVNHCPGIWNRAVVLRTPGVRMYVRDTYRTNNEDPDPDPEP